MKIIYSKLFLIFSIGICFFLHNKTEAQVNYPGAWSTKSPMLTDRAGAGAGVINGKLYVAGGGNNSGVFATMEMYDPATNSWTNKASMPTTNAIPGTGVINNKLYVVGGQITSDGSSSTTNNLYIYDPVLDEWQTKEPMASTRSHFATAAINNKIYVAGGVTNCGSCTALSSVLCYNETLNSWATVAPLPAAVSHCSGAVINGKFYVIGGYSGPGGIVVNSLYEYDPILNSWTTKTSMPTARLYIGVGVINGQLYTVSGQNAGGTASNVVEVYDPVTNSWSTRAPMPNPSLSQTAAGVIDCNLYLPGSGYNGTATTSVDVFTPCDLQDPVIICPSNLTVNCDASFLPVNTGNAVATDNCDPNPIISYNDISTQDANVANVGHYNYIISRIWKVTDGAGNSSTCSQTITVHDITTPVIICPQNLILCYSLGSNYTISQLVANDNCGINAINYQLSGATTRSGNGTNASGSFNPGVTTITWTVTDFSGNSSTCQSSVTIDQQLHVTIPDVYAFTPGAANTIYLGYGPSSLTLNAQVSGGTAPYSYSWSSGANTASIIVSPGSAGTYSYTVTITDASGCTATVVRQINVIDVRCGNDKVYMCHIPSNDPTHEVTICISPDAVAAHLAKGCRLGECIPNSMITSNPTMEQNTAGSLALKAIPNPSSNHFTLKIESNNNIQKINLRILDLHGRLVETKSNLSANQTLELGENYKPGMYIAEILQGNRKRFVKLVKL